MEQIDLIKIVTIGIIYALGVVTGTYVSSQIEQKIEENFDDEDENEGAYAEDEVTSEKREFDNGEKWYEAGDPDDPMFNNKK